ncbi:MAG: hypothetical protein WD734_02610 [Dehalococcoidia bacterium]
MQAARRLVARTGRTQDPAQDGGPRGGVHRQEPVLAGWPRRILQGALAGAVATAPMTALMEAGFRRLPRGQRYPLPPRLIVDEVADETGRRTGTPLADDEGRRTGLTLLAHFGYGAASGALFGVMPPRDGWAANAGRGALFGCAVWLWSYLGLLPALRLLAPATQHPAQRTALMVGAHLVWGAATGSTSLLIRRLAGRAALAAFRRDPPA